MGTPSEGGALDGLPMCRDTVRQVPGGAAELEANLGGGGEMGRTKIKAAVVVLSAAALIAASGALAASPQEIYRDYADNGKLDGKYTTSDLERALNNAVVQAYGHNKQKGLKPAVEKQVKSGTSGTSGTSGGAAAGGTSPTAVTVSGGLPFTGLDLSLIVVGALGLVLLGGALRRFARQRS